MAQSVFLKRGDQVNGPMKLENAQALIQKKQLKADDQISQSGDGPWERLGDVYKLVLSGEWQKVSETSSDSTRESQFKDLSIDELVEGSEDIEVPVLSVASAPLVGQHSSEPVAEKNDSQKETRSQIMDLLPMAATVMFVVVGVICVGFVGRTVYQGVISRREAGARTAIVKAEIRRKCGHLTGVMIGRIDEKGPLKTGDTVPHSLLTLIRTRNYEGDYLYTGTLRVRFSDNSYRKVNFDAYLDLPANIARASIPVVEEDKKFKEEYRRKKDALENLKREYGID